MCRLPVTLGGGRTIENGGFSLRSVARKKPRSSHSRAQRVSTGPGSYGLSSTGSRSVAARAVTGSPPLRAAQWRATAWRYHNGSPSGQGRRAFGELLSPLLHETIELLADDRLRELRDDFPRDLLDHFARRLRKRFAQERFASLPALLRGRHDGKRRLGGGRNGSKLRRLRTFVGEIVVEENFFLYFRGHSLLPGRRLGRLRRAGQSGRRRFRGGGRTRARWGRAPARGRRRRRPGRLYSGRAGCRRRRRGRTRRSRGRRPCPRRGRRHGWACAGRPRARWRWRSGRSRRTAGSRRSRRPRWRRRLRYLRWWSGSRRRRWGGRWRGALRRRRLRPRRHRLRIGEDLFHSVDELLRFERLRHLAVRADCYRPRGIARTTPAQEKHRRLLERRVAADLLAKLVTAEPRHVDVGEDQIRFQIPRPLERLRPVGDGGEGKVLLLENHSDSGPDRRRVVGQKEGLRHAGGAAGNGGVHLYPSSPDEASF